MSFISSYHIKSYHHIIITSHLSEEVKYIFLLVLLLILIYAHHRHTLRHIKPSKHVIYSSLSLLVLTLCKRVVRMPSQVIGKSTCSEHVIRCIHDRRLHLLLLWRIHLLLLLLLLLDRWR